MTNQIKTTDRNQTGMDVFTTLTDGAYAPNLYPGLENLRKDFPFLVNATVQYGLGDVWGRTGLNPKTRELAAIAAFAAIGGDGYPQMKFHVTSALVMGVTVDEIKEVFYLITVVGGFPKAINAAVAVQELLTEHDKKTNR